ncbi:MAG: hypothetical protein J5678_06115 [Bacteroidaceae bacterium]|nr:hypothetical protein [Bacteroidaceae bacterium]
MKKIVLCFAVALAATAMLSCGSSKQSPEEEQAAQQLAANGTVFEGANFTITYPKEWKETFKSEGTINAAADDNYTKMDATFSDYPCKPCDFEQYYTNLTNMSMHASFKFDKPVIEDNIMTFKGVKDDGFTMTNFVVYLDDHAGVAGSFKYPAEKAAEVEALIKPILNSIKKK